MRAKELLTQPFREDRKQLSMLTPNGDRPTLWRAWNQFSVRHSLRLPIDATFLKVDPDGYGKPSRWLFFGHPDRLHLVALLDRIDNILAL